MSPPGCFTPTPIKLSGEDQTLISENRANSCVLTCMPPTISNLTEQCAFEGIPSGLNNECGTTELKITHSYLGANNNTNHKCYSK